ncbi:MAG: hypothetical protein JW700_03635 [Candidatus Aenigmarchaeota archaeon]|nr:hypothetical protein [Candidatus Aenigmarchaeota archaeon]
MRISESISKNITESSVGHFLNKFKMKHRRDTFFFEDILANFIKECEKKGYEKEILLLGQKWLDLCLGQTIKPIFKKAPVIFMNSILKQVWINLCLIDDMKTTKKGNVVIIETKGEALTRVMGKNNLMKGAYLGIVNVIFDSKAKLKKASQTKKKCRYVIELSKKPCLHFKAKDKTLYDRLNSQTNKKGPGLKNALKQGIFRLDKKNKIFFRGKHIIAGESTLSHLIGNMDILIESIPKISFEYFSNVIEEESSIEEKLILLKNLLQIMGWGQVTIIENKNSIKLEIRNPPYGLQAEEDNWIFIINCALGYLWLFDKNFKTEKIKNGHKMVSATFSKS